MNSFNSQRGFVALMSTIVISAVLIALMAAAGMASFYARFDSLGLENKRSAQALAEACVNVALLALSTSTDPMHFSISRELVTVSIDNRGNPLTCVIKDAINNGSDVVVDTYAQSDNSFDSVTATAAVSPSVQILSWGESPD